MNANGSRRAIQDRLFLVEAHAYGHGPGEEAAHAAALSAAQCPSTSRSCFRVVPAL